MTINMWKPIKLHTDAKGCCQVLYTLQEMVCVFNLWLGLLDHFQISAYCSIK